MILAPGNEIDEAYLPEEIRDYTPPEPPPETPWYTDALPTGQQFVTLRELEDRYIREVLAATGQNKAQAARILGIHPTSLMRRLKKELEVEA
jgi:DNA-binding NtrC family response regulator